ncbi:MAG: hypothetical protein IKB84_04535 [Clostridia bacterium]|nr:hypothetical protein [Clostridia bacterium]
MDLYSKTFIHKNRSGKIVALLSLLLGGVAFALGNIDFVALPVIAQAVGVILLVNAVYIATSFLLRQYSVSIERNNADEGDVKDRYDLIIREQKGKRLQKVCHIGLCNIISVEQYNNADKSSRREEKAHTKELGYDYRYIYDTRFKAGQRMVMRASTGGFVSAVYLCFDEELYRILREHTR